MRQGRSERRGTVLVATVLLVFAGLTVLFMGGCGGGEGEAIETTTTAASSESSGASGDPSREAGVAMADRILAAFDEMTAEVAALASGKPDPAVIKPQLEELYASHLPKMTELNTAFLALRDSDEFAFQSCNGRLSDNRPQRISAMENGMVEAIKYYNFEIGDQDVVVLLTKKPIELLDIAVAQ